MRLHESGMAEKEVGLAQNGSELCLSCGLCCRGFLHNWGVLEDNELESANQLGLSVIRDEQRQGFRLPCPCFREERCVIYSQRPRACRSYRCKLLKGYLNAEIHLEDGLEIVKTAKDMIKRLELPSPEGKPDTYIWKQIVADLYSLEDEAQGLELRRMNAELLMGLAVLYAYLGRHFKLPREQTGVIQ